MNEALAIIPTVRGIIGHKGCYLCYYTPGFAHIRLLGDPNPSFELWVDIPASGDCWLPIVVLTLLAWEDSVDQSFLAVYPERQGAWTIATSDEAKRDRASFYSEWLQDGMWHVSTYFPKAKA